MVRAKLDEVRKTFNDGQVVAVDGIDLTIEEGELIVLVGPSGCGKSTTLRCIAGLEKPTSGYIYFDDVDVTDLPPKDRRISMVFQNYALYPSMTVYENMAFGLKMRGADRQKIDEQVRWAADIMEIGDLLDRYPTELSGGQQQRVALGRSIVRDPTLFLLDEPLSNLDAKLRAVMRTEIQELQKELDVATVFVTHDQEEAMTMGDRIVVMNAGRIEQVAEPEIIYHDPASIFVADFIGSPSINFFVGDYDGETVDAETFEKELPDDLNEVLAAKLDDRVVIGIRPEHMSVTDPGEGLFDVEIEVIEPLGNTQIVYFDVDEERYKLVEPAVSRLDEGDRVGIEFQWPHAQFFDPDGAKAAKWMNVVEDAESLGFLDERMTTEFDLDDLAASLEPGRDDRFEYMAMETLYRRYFLATDDDERLELPQAFWMRVAMGLALEEDDPQRRAKEFYDVLSKLEFTPSTPTLFHSGTTHPQLSSCYLTTVQDDLEDIFDSYKHHALLSKWSGGLGNDWTNLRAAGALIESTGVESTGVVPFLRISNDVTAAINRSGKRRGAACAYLACWHLDFPAFIDLKRNTGDERRRTPDMNTAAWIPDLFVERVERGGEWTLFSPDEVCDLHDLTGEAFAERYREYERRADEGELRQYERVDAADLWRRTLTRLFETGHPWLTFKDPCNVRSPQDHVGTVHSSNLCTEITLNTSADEHAVCNLGSVNYATHVADGELDREHLSETVETAMRMLDNVVDLCFYPTAEAERANLRHRPVGLGTMGFHDALMRLEVPMNSETAVEKANRWQEFVAYHAIDASATLAAERGSYPSYEGSKWDRGLFPQDTVDLLEEERGRPIPTDREETLDWWVVRERVADHGMRNSNTMAIAPTATVSTINGTTPSIEPLYSNLYVKSNMSGEFTVINDHLVGDLKERGLWDEEMMDRIKYHDGSVQEIDAVPDDLRELYRGAFEIDPRHQLRLTAHRGTWIDQSVSHNVFFPSTDGSLLDDVYRTAWRLGLKTTYYLRTLGASQIEKSTLDMDEYGKTQHRSDPGTEAVETDGGRETGADEIDGDPGLCTVNDPTCDACQ